MPGATIDVPDALLERVRPLLTQRKLTLRAVVIHALEGLVEGAAHEPFRLRDASAGYSATPDQALSPDRINQAIDELRDESP